MAKIRNYLLNNIFCLLLPLRAIPTFFCIYFVVSMLQTFEFYSSVHSSYQTSSGKSNFSCSSQLFTLQTCVGFLQFFIGPTSLCHSTVSSSVPCI